MSFSAAYLPTLDDLLDRTPITVAPETPLLDVLPQMSRVSPSLGKGEITFDAPRSYTLITKGTTLLGVFTERDVARLTADGTNLAEMTVAEGMTREPIVLKNTEYRDIFTVLSIFREHRIRHLPILDDRGQLLGVVSQEKLHDALHPANLLKMSAVSEAMSDRVVNAPSTTPVLELARQMSQHRVSCIVITEDIHPEGEEIALAKPIGIVTERDWVRYQLLGLEIDRLQAAEVMSTPLAVIHHRDSLWTARQKMQQLGVRRLVVIGDRGELRGILTQTSVLERLNPTQLYQTIEVLQQQVHQLQAEHIQELQRRNLELEQANERLQAQIEECQQTAKALYESEAKFRQLAEQIRDVFWMCDPIEDRLLYLSPAYEQVWGRSSRDVYDNLFSLLDTIDPEDREVLAEALIQQRRGETTNVEYRIVRPDGERRWIHDRGFPIRDESGQVWRLVGIAEDITDRKHAELTLHELKLELKSRVDERTAQLKQTNRQLEYEIRERQQIEVSLRFFEERFRTIFEQAAVGINIGSAEGRFIQINQKTCDIVGYSADELRTKTRLDIIDSQDRQVYLDRSEDLFRGEIDTFSIELRLIHQEGHRVWVHLTVSILITRESNPRYDVAIFEDISARKYMERELRTSQQKYQTLFETLPIGVGMTDETGNFIEANVALERILGVSIGDRIPYTCNRPPWKLVQPDRTPMLSSELASVMALTENRIIEDREEGIAKGNGEITWLSVTAAPIPLEGYGVAIAYLDITERKQTEQMKDEFIAIASHELRTPLTSLQGALGLLATGKLGEIGDRGKQLLEFAKLDTQRLVRLVNDILDLQCLKFGAQTLNLQACPIERPIEQAMGIIEPIARDVGVTLSIDSISAIAHIDSDSIVQVLTNLLANAIKFSAKGETVWLKVSQQSTQLYVSVTDRGRGIPADKLETIFEPFSQVDASDSRTHEGTGLGLAICRSIIEGHDGAIGVESKLGEGSTFYFTLALYSSK